MGGLLGRPKGMLPPLSNYWGVGGGGLATLAPPPLPTPMLYLRRIVGQQSSKLLGQSSQAPQADIIALPRAHSRLRDFQIALAIEVSIVRPTIKTSKHKHDRCWNVGWCTYMCMVINSYWHLAKWRERERERRESLFLKNDKLFHKMLLPFCGFP